MSLHLGGPLPHRRVGYGWQSMSTSTMLAELGGADARERKSPAS
jgi:hypothetical protein